jgi:hypothetical protein
MSDFFDRNGERISLHQWDTLHDTETYRRVDSDHLDDAWVSTVWLGVDLNEGGDGPPLIFETMVFTDGDSQYDNWCRRYPTLADAQAGHRVVVEAVRRGELPPT